MQPPLRIAMWSGPRNISTALMRSWENRPDAAVVDEPFYAFYLRETGRDHPGREQVLAADRDDWRAVAARLTGPVPGGKAIWYQKHMAHHLLPGIERGWMDELVHAFLIRDPREMLLSLDKVTRDPALKDTGLPQQVALYEHFVARGVTPPVIDARDVLEAPEAQLRALCAALGVPFLPAMLSWPPGSRATDGVWAPYWYASVERSSGFEPYKPSREELPRRLQATHDAARALYQKLYDVRLRT